MSGSHSCRCPAAGDSRSPFCTDDAPALMRLFGSFRDDRALQRAISAYVDVLLLDPAPTEVDWLSAVGTRGDVDHARWELRYLRRSLGMLVAQRDALDDRTPSEVLRTLAARMARDPNVDDARRDLSERQFNARLSAYRDAFTSRGLGTPALRVAQNLLAFAGGPIRADDPAVIRGAGLVTESLEHCAESLRARFGTVQLPEDIPPSQLVR